VRLELLLHAPVSGNQPPLSPFKCSTCRKYPQVFAVSQQRFTTTMVNIVNVDVQYVVIKH